jgi:hypothetical protein
MKCREATIAYLSLKKHTQRSDDLSRLISTTGQNTFLKRHSSDPNNPCLLIQVLTKKPIVTPEKSRDNKSKITQCT